MDVRGFETDKAESGYLETYRGLAATLPRDAAICELGVYRGGSLALWKVLFPHASVIVGVDVDPNAIWPLGTVKVVADQQDPTLADQLVTMLASEALGHSSYDLIVDDASHEGHRTYKAFVNLWKLVSPGGYYVIEDWCVGFNTFPNYDRSMLEFAMMMVNLFEDPRTDVHFVSYTYGMIVIRKKMSPGPVQGGSNGADPGKLVVP